MIAITEAKHGFMCQNCFDKDDVKEIDFRSNGTGIIVRLCVKCRDELIRVLLNDNKPVKPTNDKGNFCCGSCGNPLHTAIVNPMIRFCDHCGKHVDWKDGE